VRGANVDDDTLKTPRKISLALLAVAVLGIAGWWVSLVTADPVTAAREGIQ
jgi:hypothetical protein